MSDGIDDKEVLAAEYTLGTLNHQERRQAETRLETDRAFARMAAAWSRRLAPLLYSIRPLAPSRKLWPRIRAAIGDERLHEAPGLRQTPRTSAVPYRERLGLWRLMTAGATAMAASMALYIAVTPFGQAPEGQYVAVLDSGPRQPAWLVRVDTAARQMTVRPYGELKVAGHSYELWFVRGPDVQPRSLGLLNPEDDRAIQIKGELGRALPRAAAFAISLEPAGGSTTGSPTGPVVFQGAIRPLVN